jgi:hypothetical protein
MTLVGACALALAADVLAPSEVSILAASGSAAGAVRAATDTSRAGSGIVAEHRYRIMGKLRLALFWLGRDDVGSARLTWRSDGSTSALTLLIGSDPQRAPRNLNQWGYLREEVRSNQADVFSLRSLNRDQAAPPAGFGVGDGPRFGVSCSSIEDHDVSSTHTTIDARGVTYRMFDQLLDRIAVSPQWEGRRSQRPVGADAGFLTALQRAIRMGMTGSGHPKAFRTLKPVTYIYNNAIYDLMIRSSEPLGRTTVGARTFEELTRTDLSIRNRTTGDVSQFGVTSSSDPAGPSLPVQIFYQPSFWLRVELRLDDDADVPADPAADGSTLTRIRAICANAAH